MCKDYIDEYWSMCRGYVYTITKYSMEYTMGDGYQTVALCCLQNKGKDKDTIKKLCIQAIKDELNSMGTMRYIHTIDNEIGDSGMDTNIINENLYYTSGYNDYRKNIIYDIDRILSNEEKHFLNDVFGLNKKGMGFRGYAISNNITIDNVKKKMLDIRKKVKDNIKASYEDIIEESIVKFDK